MDGLHGLFATQLGFTVKVERVGRISDFVWGRRAIKHIICANIHKHGLLLFAQTCEFLGHLDVELVVVAQIFINMFKSYSVICHCIPFVSIHGPSRRHPVVAQRRSELERLVFLFA